MTDNTVLMEFSSAASSLGAGLISFGASGKGFFSVSIDSRAVSPGALFVALTGSEQDGHAYVEAAFKAGAAAALVAEGRMEQFGLEKAARDAEASLLVTGDTLSSLQRLAGAYLAGFPGLLRIGITGSSGKTTTKEIAAAMVGREKGVVMNPGNLNSETGLPLAVFNVRAHHQAGIFEMGMNRKGEIRELAEVLKPQIALITNIGSAHIGIFGSTGAIIEEKKQIFSCFEGTETALIPLDSPCRDDLAKNVRGRVVFYGNGEFSELGPVRDLGLSGWEIVWDGLPARFGLAGKHNLKNALAAAAIAREIPLKSSSVREGLEEVKPLFGRSEVLQGDLTVIQDCYNASPESVLEALSLCDGLQWPGRKVYIIGSMLELGAASEEAHEKLGTALAASKADMVYLFGEETRPALGAWEARGKNKRFPAVFQTRSMEELSASAAGFVRKGDLVLLKASRLCALERLTDTLLAAGRGGKL